MRIVPDTTQAEGPVYPAAVAGYRVFRVSAMPRLHSVHTEHVWRPGVNHAECLADDFYPLPDADQCSCHQAPAIECSCGLQAFYHLQQAQDYLDTQLNPAAGAYVIGLVAGAGKVRMHQIGWRAQQAQVLALLAGTDTEKNSIHLHQLKAEYRIRICTEADELYRLEADQGLLSADRAAQIGAPSFRDAWVGVLELQQKMADHGY